MNVMRLCVLGLFVIASAAEAASGMTFSVPAGSDQVVIIESPTISPMSGGTGGAFFSYIIAPQSNCNSLSVYFGVLDANKVESGNGSGVAYWTGRNVVAGKKFRKQDVVPYSDKGHLFVKRVICLRPEGGPIEFNSNL